MSPNVLNINVNRCTHPPPLSVLTNYLNEAVYCSSILGQGSMITSLYCVMGELHTHTLIL